MPPDIKTKFEADRLRAELSHAAPAYTMEPDGLSIDERNWRLQQYKANRLRHVGTALVRKASAFRRDTREPFNRSFEPTRERKR